MNMKPTTTTSTTTSNLNVPNGGPDCNERMPLLQQTQNGTSTDTGLPTEAEAAQQAAARAPNHVPVRGVSGGSGTTTPAAFTGATGNPALVAMGQTMIPPKNDSKRIMIAKQSRPRKAIAEFRKKGRGVGHWSAWTGRVGVHVKVDEINIEKLSAEIEKKLPGWKAVDHYDVVRVWQTEPPFVGHDSIGQGVDSHWPPVTEDEPLSATPTPMATPPSLPATAPSTMPTAAGFMTGAHAVMETAVPEVYIFSFGAVVFWNFPGPEYEEHWLDQNIFGLMADACGEAHNKEEIVSAADDMAFTFGETFSIKRDIAQLTTRETGEKLAVSFALAKSSLLSIYEERVQRVIDRNSHIPEEMAKNGRIHMTREEIGKEVGKMFLVKHGINLDCSLIDTPEEFWEDDRFEATYESTLKYFEITKRLTLVNNRLHMIGELHQVMIEENQNHHAVVLEWIIIVLIVVEVVLDLLHMGVF
jgi:uncharacterized Rmd1/YagE family protein